ncbi:MAG: transposase [Pseudomonadota bacterium]|nr:transposase [Pseudomonadota bacterium]
MARQLRILFPGAWYHVMNRGVNRQAIFFKIKHRKLFIDLLKYLTDVFKVEIHAYCLMTNHYHILLRTWKPNLPVVMHYLDSMYAKSLNKDMSRDGPLFRGRFKSILVEQDEYLLHLSRYIHLNPFDAGLIKNLGDFRWSSYPYYIGTKRKPVWLHTDFVHGYFQGGNIFEQYKKYTEAGNDPYIEKFYSSEKIKPILGTKEFIRNLNITKSSSGEIADSEYLSIKITLSTIMESIEKMTGKSKDSIMRSARGQSNDLRSAFIYLSRKIAGHRITDIAIYLSNCHYSTVSAALSRFEKKLTSSDDLQSLIAICKMEIFRIVKSNPLP